MTFEISNDGGRVIFLGKLVTPVLAIGKSTQEGSRGLFHDSFDIGKPSGREDLVEVLVDPHMTLVEPENRLAPNGTLGDKAIPVAKFVPFFESIVTCKDRLYRMPEMGVEPCNFEVMAEKEQTISPGRMTC